jgi:hypothetical protein
MIAVCLLLRPCKPAPAHGHLLDFRPVLRNRAALGYILGYGAHCFELYGMRTWIVAFWTFVMARSDGGALVGPVAVSLIYTLLSLPASLLGNEAALRYGRHRAISVVMVASAAVASAIGFNAGSSPLLLLALVLAYGLTVPADSGALTSGTTQVPRRCIAARPWHCIRRSDSGFPRSAAGAPASRSMPPAVGTSRRDGVPCSRCSRPAFSSDPSSCAGRGGTGEALSRSCVTRLGARGPASRGYVACAPG